MTKKELLKIGLIVFAAGLVAVLLAPTIGSWWGNFYLRNICYGSMDTSAFLLIKQSTCTSWQIIGGITAFLSGLEILLTFFFYRDKDEVNEEQE